MNAQNMMIAIVIDNNDPEKQGRVLLTIPALPGGPQLWARVVAPYAGSDRGLCMLPEIDDEVLVFFTQGDLSGAYVLGSLWGAKKAPPEGSGEKGNDVKEIKTRSGHMLKFEDGDDNERITLTDKNGNAIVITTGEDCITITSKSDVKINADKNISLKANNISLKAKEIKIEADSSLTLDGGSTADLKAGTVNIN